MSESGAPAVHLRLVADAVVVPGAGGPEVLIGGVVDIDPDGRIAGVASLSEAGDAPQRVERVGGLLMPGLVNGHAHGPMTLVRSAGDGLPLQQWLTDAVWPREGRMTPGDVRLGMTLASIEMLRAGITTSVEMYLFEDAVADAVEVTGARAHVMAGVISAIAPDDDTFRARLDAVADFHERRHDPAKGLGVGIGPHSVWDLGPDRLADVAALAADLDAPIHIHLEETEFERHQVLDEHGVSATALLQRAGAFDRRVVAAHGVWLSDEDMVVLGTAGATVVHCPTSNLKLGSGIAQVGALLDAGVGVAIGTDGAASNDDLDMWEEMRLAGLLARGVAHDPTAVSAGQVFDLATSGGARALGIDDVGELRPGAWADIVRIDLDQPALVPGQPDELLGHLVWAGNARQVTDVWVAGRRVVEQGEVTTVDRDAVQAEARSAGSRLSSDG